MTALSPLLPQKGGKYFQKRFIEVCQILCMQLQVRELLLFFSVKMVPAYKPSNMGIFPHSSTTVTRAAHNVICLKSSLESAAVPIPDSCGSTDTVYHTILQNSGSQLSVTVPSERQCAGGPKGKSENTLATSRNVFCLIQVHKGQRSYYLSYNA